MTYIYMIYIIFQITFVQSCNLSVFSFKRMLRKFDSMCPPKHVADLGSPPYKIDLKTQNVHESLISKRVKVVSLGLGGGPPLLRMKIGKSLFIMLIQELLTSLAPLH